MRMEKAGHASAAAARIDELARVGKAFEGIERRFLPWAIGSAALFIIGIALIFVPGTAGRAVLPICLAALPAVAIAYVWRTSDRTRADNEIEALNREHFAPEGGLYFPAGERPACVVRVPPVAPAPVHTDDTPRALRDPRKRSVNPGRLW